MPKFAKKPLLSINVRAVVYSFMTLTDLMEKVCKFSREDRAVLVKSKILDQKRKLKLNMSYEGNIDIEVLDYLVKLASEIQFEYHQIDKLEASLIHTVHVQSPEKVGNSFHFFKPAITIRPHVITPRIS